MSGIPTKGYLRNYSLPRMLVFLNRHRVTGILTVVSQGITKKIYLKKGNAVFASSTYEDDRLGEMLVKAGKITMRHYDEAVGVMKRTGKRLGAVLVELKYLTPKDLFWGVNYQVQEIIYSLFQLKDGLYEFKEGKIPAEVITLDLSMANIIFEGVRRIEDWTRIKNEMPDLNTVYIFSEDPMSLFQDICLSEKDKKILSFLNGERSINKIVEDSKINNFDVVKTLYVLWSVGMITEQFGHAALSLTVDDILKPVEDKKEEFISRVNSIFSVLESLSHHQLLAVDEHADIETINSQYYKLSKEFHPDRYGGSLDPEIKDRIKTIFDAINYAYKSLKSSETSRQFTEGDEILAQEMLKNAKDEIKKGNFQQAADFLNEAVTSNPDSSECWNYYALALTKLPGRLKDAEDSIKRAQRLDPENSDYYSNLGLIYLKGKRTDEAKSQFEKAISINPKDIKAQKGLAKLSG